MQLSIYCHLLLLGILSDLKTAKQCWVFKTAVSRITYRNRHTKWFFFCCFFFLVLFSFKDHTFILCQEKGYKIEVFIYMPSNTKQKNKQTKKTKPWPGLQNTQCAAALVETFTDFQGDSSMPYSLENQMTYFGS